MADEWKQWQTINIVPSALLFRSGLSIEKPQICTHTKRVYLVFGLNYTTNPKFTSPYNYRFALLLGIILRCGKRYVPLITDGRQSERGGRRAKGASSLCLCIANRRFRAVRIELWTVNLSDIKRLAKISFAHILPTSVGKKRTHSL